MKNKLYQHFVKNKQQGQKSLAVLIDPDKVDNQKVEQLVSLAVNAKVDYLLVGGSLIISSNLDEVIQQIKSLCDIPVILFPGNPAHVSKYADALLYLSLVSGRNPELLIGQHVVSAPFVKKSGLEIMPTGYMLVDGGAPTTVSYISNATPLPSDKNEIALCTAMASEMLGMKLIYMDAGSGARRPQSFEKYNKLKKTKMKARLTVTIDKSTIVSAKKYAIQNRTTLSKLVGTFLMSVGTDKDNPQNLSSKVTKPMGCLPLPKKFNYKAEVNSGIQKKFGK